MGQGPWTRAHGPGPMGQAHGPGPIGQGPWAGAWYSNFSPLALTLVTCPTSGHRLGGALEDFYWTFQVLFNPFLFSFVPNPRKLGLREEDVSQNLHSAPINGPRTFLKNQLNFGPALIRILDFQ